MASVHVSTEDCEVLAEVTGNAASPPKRAKRSMDPSQPTTPTPAVHVSSDLQSSALSPTQDLSGPDRSRTVDRPLSSSSSPWGYSVVPESLLLLDERMCTSLTVMETDLEEKTVSVATPVSNAGTGRHLSRSASAVVGEGETRSMGDEPMDVDQLPCLLAGSTDDGAQAAETLWEYLPDDLLKRLLTFLAPSYLRVFRLVCKPWEQASGRFLNSLSPEAMPMFPSLAQRFPNLTMLDLSKCLCEVQCYRAKELRLRSMLADQHMQSLLGLARLRKLRLRGCSGITNEGLRTLLELPTLEKLDLSRCNTITDAAMDIVAMLPKLRSLHLAGCQGITDAGLASLAKQTMLEQLDVSRCNEITNGGVGHIARIKGLRRLNLDQCRNVTDVGLQTLVELPALRHVSLSWCSCVMGTGLQALAQLTCLETLDISYVTQGMTDSHVSLLG